jgi:hypothetical protein
MPVAKFLRMRVHYETALKVHVNLYGLCLLAYADGAGDNCLTRRKLFVSSVQEHIGFGLYIDGCIADWFICTGFEMCNNKNLCFSGQKWNLLGHSPILEIVMLR